MWTVLDDTASTVHTHYLKGKTMWAVQFSADGVKFHTLIKYDQSESANSLRKACAGWACEHKKYRRVIGVPE